MTEEDVRRIVRDELIRHRAIARVHKAQEKKQNPPALTHDEIAEAIKKMALGVRPTEMIAALGVSRAAFYDALRRYQNKSTA